VRLDRAALELGPLGVCFSPGFLPRVAGDLGRATRGFGSIPGFLFWAANVLGPSRDFLFWAAFSGAAVDFGRAAPELPSEFSCLKTKVPLAADSGRALFRGRRLLKPGGW